MNDGMESLDPAVPSEKTLESVLEGINQRKRAELVEKAAQLNVLCQTLLETSQFNVGDIVVWKEGLRNKARPEDGELAIVLELLDEPVYDDSDDAGSPYFHEPLSLRLGIIDEDGDFLSYLYDAKRFQKLKL